LNLKYTNKHIKTLKTYKQFVNESKNPNTIKDFLDLMSPYSVKIREYASRYAKLPKKLEKIMRGFIEFEDKYTTVVSKHFSDGKIAAHSIYNPINDKIIVKAGEKINTLDFVKVPIEQVLIYKGKYKPNTKVVDQNTIFNLYASIGELKKFNNDKKL
jgi:hypothetical protein